MTIKNILSLVAVAILGACNSEGPQNLPTDPNNVENPTGSTDPNNVFDHPPDIAQDPFELLQRLQTQGPPEAQAQMHSCTKIRYATLGSVLKSRGVNLAATGATTAGRIYTTSDLALGVANYGARQPEATDLTAATAAKMFDIWVAAAPEMVTAMPSQASCMVGGVATAFFDTAGKCTRAGIECITGLPATQTHVDLCNQIVASASTPAIGQTIAVASIAAAAQTCE